VLTGDNLLNCNGYGIAILEPGTMPSEKRLPVRRHSCGHEHAERQPAREACRAQRLRQEQTWLAMFGPDRQERNPLIQNPWRN
jgi:hypothetical protein